MIRALQNEAGNEREIMNRVALEIIAGIDGEQAAQAIPNDHADSSKKIG